MHHHGRGQTLSSMASPKLVGQSALKTEEVTSNKHTISGNKVQEHISPQVNIEASPDTGLDSFQDSGFFEWEDERSDPRQHPHDYEDFILFDLDAPFLNPDNFFADLDETTSTVDDGANIERGTVSAAEDGARTVFYDPIHDAVQISISQSIYDIVSDFDACSPPHYTPLYKDTPIHTPLEKWTNTHERHESMFDRLAHQPNTAPLAPARQPSRQSR